MIARYAEALGREVLLRPGTTDEDVFRQTFVRQFHVPPEQLDPSSVLDLGCNIGLTVAHYEALWPHAEIVGVELDAENCLLARRNCRRARIVHAAVSPNGGRQRYSGDEAWSYRIDPLGDRSVEGQTLDDLVDSIGDRIDFVKMDIEGAEWDVLACPGPWPERIDTLLVEIHGTEGRRQAGIDEIAGLLTAKGFVCRAHEIHWCAVWARRSDS